MPKTRRRNPTREKFWHDTVAAWQEWGQSVGAFCAARGVSEATFFALRRELADQQPSQRPTGPAPQFVPVKVVPDPTIDVILPSGLWSEWVFPQAEGGTAVEKLTGPTREIILSALAPAA